jgi:hypothetical protein
MGSGEKNAQRLNRCSASSVSNAVDIAQVADTAGKSRAGSLSRRWAFAANRTS